MLNRVNLTKFAMSRAFNVLNTSRHLYIQITCNFSKFTRLLPFKLFAQPALKIIGGKGKGESITNSDYSQITYFP